MFLKLQLDYLYWLQNIRETTQNFLTPFFLHATKFGEYMIPILTCSTIYWCINKKLGILMILNTAAALMINQLLKNIACIYRPWMLDSRIKPVEAALRYAGGYSFPSGHSSLALSCWGSLGLWYKENKKIVFSAILICLAVAFSRNYLGVHTLQDIIIGLLTAYITLIAFHRLLKWCEQKEHRDLILAIATTVISLFITIYTSLKGYPTDYDANGLILVAPETHKWESLPKLGLMLGSVWGWYIENNFVKFTPETQSLKEKIICGICGIIPLMLITKYTMPLWKDAYGKDFGGLGFMITVSLFITLIYPWIYKNIIAKKMLPAQKTESI